MIIESNVNLYLYPNLFFFPDNAENFHHNLFCARCGNTRITNFRYTCLQCRDYNLCGQCEHAMHHSDHLMIRLSRENMQTLEVYMFFHLYNIIQQLELSLLIEQLLFI
jgi:hypothetical protein